MDKKEGKSFGITGFILGLLSVILFWIPIFGFILGLCGIIFSSIQIKRRSTGLAVAGLILGIIGVVIGIFFNYSFFWSSDGINTEDNLGLNQTIVLVKTELEYVFNNNLYTDKVGGSGVIYLQDGDKSYIVTNRHVIDCFYGGSDCGKIVDEKIKVITYDGKEYDILKTSLAPNGLDLAILEVKFGENNYTSARISNETKSGSSVTAIGYPGFSQTARELLIRKGKITGTRTLRTEEGFDFEAIDSTAYINFGSSGGGLFNKEGLLIGITTWKDEYTTYAIKSDYITPLDTFSTCKKNYYFDGEKCTRYYCPWVLENFECIKPCEDFYCEMEEIIIESEDCEDSSMILGEDEICRYPCGSNETYCQNLNSYCYQNECFSCPQNYILFENGKCYTSS